MPPELSIIIVNWNGGSLLRRCVETIVSAKPPVSYEILVIDNASEDDSLDQLRGSQPIAPLRRHSARRSVSRWASWIGIGISSAVSSVA